MSSSTLAHLRLMTFSFLSQTEDQKWKDRVDKLVDHGLKTFFKNGIAFEPNCEESNTCTTDMRSFKGYMARWYSVVTQLCPWTAPIILPTLKTSAQAAVKQCTGGKNGRQCGFSWSTGVFDGNLGVGEQMDALAAVSSLLIGETPGPVTADTGGTSEGNVNAGSDSNSVLHTNKPITTGDRAGAAILTILILGGSLGMFSWMSLGS